MSIRVLRKFGYVPEDTLDPLHYDVAGALGHLLYVTECKQFSRVTSPTSRGSKMTSDVL